MDRMTKEYIEKIELEQKEQIKQFMVLQKEMKQRMIYEFESIKSIYEFTNSNNIKYITQNIKMDELEK